ncbi:MAG: DoxX family protein [Congregibacter sp.]
MESAVAFSQRSLLLIGRTMLGLYFFVFAIQKMFNWSDIAGYMAAFEVPLIPVLLPMTVAIQLGAGFCLIVGYRAHLSSFLLAGLTLVISLYMHDFWTMEQGTQRAHEMQNFIKNLAIMAGLMYVSGTCSTEAREGSIDS